MNALNPIGQYVVINADAPSWVKSRLKPRGVLSTKRAWKIVNCGVRKDDGEFCLTLLNVWGEKETIPSRYFSPLR